MLRDYYTSRPKEKGMMTEKVRADTLFKGKKSLYIQSWGIVDWCVVDLSCVCVCVCSVPEPFKADRISLRSDDRWSRIVAETHEQRIIWADRAHKINRKDGKVNSLSLFTLPQLSIGLLLHPGSSCGDSGDWRFHHVTGFQVSLSQVPCGTETCEPGLSQCLQWPPLCRPH